MLEERNPFKDDFYVAKLCEIGDACSKYGFLANLLLSGFLYDSDSKMIAGVTSIKSRRYLKEHVEEVDLL